MLHGVQTILPLREVRRAMPIQPSCRALRRADLALVKTSGSSSSGAHPPSALIEPLLPPVSPPPAIVSIEVRPRSPKCSQPLRLFLPFALRYRRRCSTIATVFFPESALSFSYSAMVEQGIHLPSGRWCAPEQPICWARRNAVVLSATTSVLVATTINRLGFWQQPV